MDRTVLTIYLTLLLVALGGGLFAAWFGISCLTLRVLYSVWCVLTLSAFGQLAYDLGVV